jgi:glycosyltransferase involved in cell wall biosynthesis
MARQEKAVHVMRRFVPEKWGGTENAVLNLSRACGRQGMECTIFCTDLLSRPGPDRYEGIVIRRFRHLLPWFGLSEADRQRLRLKGGSPLSLPLFFALLRERNLSLIHTHVQHRLGGMARTAARLKRIPYVVSIHGGYYTLPPEQADKMSEPFRGKPEWGKLFGFLFGARRVLRDADAILCVGQDEYEACLRHHPASRVFRLPNGVDVERFSGGDGRAFRAAYGFRADERIVLCAARIDYQKNQIGLVRTFKSFSKTHPDHRLVLVGPVTVEAYHDRLVREIERLKLNGAVRIIPGLRPDDPLLPGAYRAAELFVLASVHEPFGMVVLEAWAAGLPVLAYAVGGVPGFCTDGEDSLLVEAGDEPALARGMAALADRRALREALARCAGERVRARYDWAAAAERLLEIYRRILSD